MMKISMARTRNQQWRNRTTNEVDTKSPLKLKVLK